MKKLILILAIVALSWGVAGCDKLNYPGVNGKILAGRPWVISQDVTLDTYNSKGYVVKTLLWDESGNNGGIVWNRYDWETPLDQVEKIKKQAADEAFVARDKMVAYVINMKNEKETKE